MQLSPETAVPLSNIETIALDVSGMKCAGCVKVVEKQLIQHPGVLSACVNLVTEVATVEYETDTVAPEKLAKVLTEAGFPTQPRQTQMETRAIADPQKRQREIQQQIQQLAIAAGLILLSGIGHFSRHAAPLTNIWFHWGLATLALLFPGRAIIIEGWRGLRRNAPNMNTLVALGTLSAYLASCVALIFPQLGWECFFDEPVMLLGFILLGRTLEKRAKDRAAQSLQSLLALQPQKARLIANPAEAHNPQSMVEIPAYSVKVGEWLQVLPGEQIPVDGEVRVGQTTIDESMLTGESIPVPKQPGDPVSAGTLNQLGVIAICCTRTGQDTTLARIVQCVETAQTRKAPIQKLADTVAGYFTYGVLTAAVFTFGFWYFVGTHLWGEVLTAQDVGGMAHGMAMGVQSSPLLLSLKLAIAVSVIACPCALGLATPTAILVGTGMGAERGILIKGGDVLEQVHHLDTIVFDKTGTLTVGQPTVTDCQVFDPQFTPQALLALASAVESGTNHPLAKAILQAARCQNLTIPEAVDFQTVSGFGVSAQVNTDLVILGTRDWLTQQEIELTDSQLAVAQTLAEAGKTVAFVAVNRLCVGLIAVFDEIRPEAKTTVQQLQQMGLRVMMLTGDRQATAAAVAQAVGIAPDNILAEIRPEGKAEAIAQLQAGETPRIVAMVGDGINDAPALAQANIGISLYAGTDVAIETAQIVLMRDRLSDVLAAIRLGRATFRKIQQNLFWAFLYNSLGIPIAAGILLPAWGLLLAPSAAGALMAFSSVSVVTNSLMLRQTFPESKPATLEKSDSSIQIRRESLENQV